MKFFPEKQTVSRRVMRSVQMAVLLALGVLVGGTIAYAIGSGVAVESREMAASADGDAAPALPGAARAAWFDTGSERLMATRRAVPAAVVAEERPKIVIIIDDIGMNRRAFDRLVLLPEPMTFSILPYAADAQLYADLARRTGHDVMLHLPMAPAGADGPSSAGPDTLRLADSPAELRRKLALNLAKFSGYSGINNHMGSGLTADPFRMEIVLERIERDGVYFIDSVTSGATAVEAAAGQTGMAYIHRDVFLDSDYEEVTEETVAAQLRLLESVARSKGYAIGIGHPYDSTVTALQDWAATAGARGFEVITASALVEWLETPVKEEAEPARAIVRLR
ncbi:divergent polysaccharide deacetylase family protein [Aquisalinus flavus]|uniref:Divergent polysaccharide deacetylase family protein n=1 Tax=Aquisalinus flavus TaxID=1526572 RepID=A0A8J2Y3F4_9PROT|nr:divergent polysaccharide deacetylase family protein [Aquisalinus flavus]MBD0427791.1 divergent polysaccharide deacetylase family protein [Aquisalinus flavus]UNE47564.1 divergent polysaccharide deacetylase family protein [Aquisalinus flavus]GGD03859.1 hypothetical protein GCM10011342_11060 [Aquisalinus flavus]